MFMFLIDFGKTERPACAAHSWTDLDAWLEVK